MLLVQYALLGFPKPPTGAVSSPPVSHAPRPPRQESRHEQFHDQHLYAPLALDHTVPPGDPPSQRAGVGAANGIDEAGNCGTLVPFGQVTIRHPSRGDNNASEFDVGPPVLMVAYDDDRVFAVPLDGMTFDADRCGHHARDCPSGAPSIASVGGVACTSSTAPSPPATFANRRYISNVSIAPPAPLPHHRSISFPGIFLCFWQLDLCVSQGRRAC